MKVQEDLYAGFSCILNILRTADIVFLSYTKNYLPAKNQEYSMIPTELEFVKNLAF